MKWLFYLAARPPRWRWQYIVSLMMVCLFVKAKGQFGVPLPIARDTQGQPLPSAVPSIPSSHENRVVVSPALVGAGVSQSKFENQPSPLGAMRLIDNPENDEGVQALLKHPAVLKRIQKGSSIDKAVRVREIIAAHRQVVSGEVTYLDVKAVETKCPIGAPQTQSCPTDLDEDPHVCEVAVWVRPWLNSTKVIDQKSRCAEVEKESDFKNWKRGSPSILGRSLGQLVTLPALPRHLNEQQVALEAFEYIDRGAESKFKGRMVDYQIGLIKHDPVLNVTKTNVVVEYGFTLCLKFPNRKADGRICPLDSERDNYECRVTVVADPNLTSNLKVIPGDEEDIKCEKKSPVAESLVVPVAAVCLGCAQPASFNDPAIERVAQLAAIHYDQHGNHEKLHTLLRLHKAHKQVVNGIKYTLTLELSETECRKSLSAINMNRTLCPLDSDVVKGDTTGNEICEVEALEQPWQKRTEITHMRCFDKDDYNSGRDDELIVPVLGVPLLFSPPNVPTAAAKSASPSVVSSLVAPSPAVVDLIVKEFNRREVDDSDDGMYRIIKVVDVQSSAESVGHVDHIVMELGETICTRRMAATRSECPLRRDEEREICAASVLRGNVNRLLSLRCHEMEDHPRLTATPSISPFTPVGEPFFLEPSRPSHDSVLNVASPTSHSNMQPQRSDLPDVTNVAHFVADQFNLQNDDDEMYKLNKVISAFKQARSDTRIYTIEVELVETRCKKFDPVLDVSKCPIDPTEDPEICQAEVIVSRGQRGENKRLDRIFCDEREDYYVKKMTRMHSSAQPASSPSQGSSTLLKSPKAINLGHLIADEFDFRTDEDNIFLLVKVVQLTSTDGGMKHKMRVELAETICPKYKEGINKKRCAIDIGEEHKICDAELSERPWVTTSNEKSAEVTKLRCFERDDSKEHDDHSDEEVLYPRVRPSAHARPKFVQSRYRVRQHSRESEESNEKFYIGFRHVDSHEHQNRPSSRHEIYDSDEFGLVNPGRRRFDDDDDDRSGFRLDNESRSFENIRSFGRPLRFRRSNGQNNEHIEKKIDLLTLTQDAVERSSLALLDPRLVRVKNVVVQDKQINSNGTFLKLKVEAFFTKCLRGENRTLNKCRPDKNESSFSCNFEILKTTLNEVNIKKSICV